ncbi:nucleotidyl transferase AbiEii/AbiGii toxin family protein [Hymenobacter sp. H14-R3]|uniref:nucleotidyl transferase AbiEii/AbiGii toxin family protein n=1 Tax=Hymenobacter sp. H14-R3 TaxID=3046308 RepID=UPI0024BB1E76|nr:nucleotidyl transferase AbiEii/AbiGii toxin family protein [Hymenobacter sp. H14-R3]MDJ0366787.1 nucleotidyl transferase AbiEii/AbiGii toxin family protein [Hymenobacter sp. H14-R3]
MQLTTEQYLEITASEAFIRRAAELDLPFMLKGSYVTRQYFADPLDRQPMDLDWVYIGGHLEGVPEARVLFNDWVTRVTELPAADAAMFRSFQQNAFWRGIDYAMADDFPTINTDLQCGVPDAAGQPQRVHLRLDVSFNLPFDLSSECLVYRPLEGEPFLIGHTTPLALQVAWKLHQTLVRPRPKDLFDLVPLLRHANFTPAVRGQALEALQQECRADGTDPGRLHYLLAGDLAPLFTEQQPEKAWQHWRHNEPADGPGLGYGGDQAHYITNADNLPTTLAGFVLEVRAALSHAGFGPGALPPPRPARTDASASRKPVSDKRREFLDNRLDFMD